MKSRRSLHPFAGLIRAKSFYAYAEKLCAPGKAVACNGSGSGLSIVELLVAIVLISVAVSGAVSLLNSGIFGLRRTESNYSIQNLIDRNLSQIESAADRYVCTTTTCTVSSTIPSKSDYVNPNDASVWSAFTARCLQNDFSGEEDLLSPLVEYINDNIPVPPGLGREIQINGSGSTSDVGFGRIKHFTVNFREGSSTGNVLRNSTIVPTLVSYCP